MYFVLNDRIFKSFGQELESLKKYVSAASKTINNRIYNITKEKICYMLDIYRPASRKINVFLEDFKRVLTSIEICETKFVI